MAESEKVKSDLAGEGWSSSSKGTAPAGLSSVGRVSGWPSWLAGEPGWSQTHWEQGTFWPVIRAPGTRSGAGGAVSTRPAFAPQAGIAEFGRAQQHAAPAAALLRACHDRSRSAEHAAKCNENDQRNCDATERILHDRFHSSALGRVALTQVSEGMRQRKVSCPAYSTLLTKFVMDLSRYSRRARMVGHADRVSECHSTGFPGRSVRGGRR